MRRSIIIRKFIASALLLLFITGSAPKTWFHDLVADHKDGVSCDDEHSTTVLHKQSVNCHFDDWVVTQPFILAPSSTFTATNFHFDKKLAAYFSSYSPAIVQYHENRGPPAA